MQPLYSSVCGHTSTCPRQRVSVCLTPFLPLTTCSALPSQDEERLLMVEQKRKMEEERRALERAQKKAVKAQQDIILNRKGGRQRLAFSLTPKTE